MSSQPDVTRVVRSWLEEGVDRLPDRVLDSVLDLVPSTPQRRSSWSARRASTLPTVYRVAIAAAAVLVAAVAGITLLPHTGVGTIGKSPAPSASARPTALDTIDVNRILPAGAYRVGTFFARPLTLQLPDGWAMRSLAQGDVSFRRDQPANGAPWIVIDLIQGIVSDPCHSEAGVASPFPATVDETVLALKRMVGFSVGPATSITFDGFVGAEVELTNAIDTSTANCANGPMLPLWTFRGGPKVGGGTNGGATEHLWIVDVHGWIVVIDGETFPETPDATRQEMLRIVQTIRFD